MNDETPHRPASCASRAHPRKERICATPSGRGGSGCPTLTRADVLEAANEAYRDESVRAFARQASIQEAECYANRDQRPYVM